MGLFLLSLLQTKRYVAACVAAVGFVVVTASPAGAHAVLLSTEPSGDEVVAAAPDEVVLTFNEPVELAFGAVRVFDTRARRVDEGQASHASPAGDSVQIALPGDLRDGTYTVTWRVISADGHPVAGVFTFHVGAPGPRPEGVAEAILAGEAGAGPLEGALYGLFRWVNFLALLLLAGAVFFLLTVWARGEDPARPVEVERVLATRWRKVAVWSWAVAVAVTPPSLVLQAAVAGGMPLGDAIAPAVVGEVLATRFARVALVKLGLLGAAALLWVVGSRVAPVPVVSARLAPGVSTGAAAAGPRSPRRWAAGAGLVAVGLLATPGLAGHAGVTPPVAANLAADAVHMAGAAAWLGGLVLLLAGVFPATRGLGDERPAVLVPVVSRFSDAAVVAVFALVATGAYRAWVEVRALEALTGTSYGRVLLVKLLVFAPLLVLGFVNNRVLKPRIRKAAEEGGHTGAIASIKRTIGVEVALITVVIAVTALLVSLPPGRVDAGVTGPFIADVRLGEDNLNVVVDPNRVGENLVHLTVTSPQGTPVEIEAMRVEFTMPEEQIGPLVGEGAEVGPGHFVVQGRQLSIAGEWVLEIVADRDEFTRPRTAVEVEVNR